MNELQAGESPSRRCLPSAVSRCIREALRVRQAGGFRDAATSSDGLGMAAGGAGSWRPACHVESTPPATDSLKVW